MPKDIQHYLEAANAYNSGDFAWVIVSTIFCWQITLGVGLLYAGYTNRKNAVSVVWTSACVLVMSSISVSLLYSYLMGPTSLNFAQWILFGVR